MKFPILKIKRDRGAALLITVILLAFAALYFVTYLVLAANEYNIVARSQTWNEALTAAEAGAEEGLALVNKNAYDTTVITNWPVSASSDGWTNIITVNNATNSYQVFYLQRTMPNNNNESYSVYVTNVISSGNSYGIPQILSIGTVNNNKGPSVSRSVLIQTAAVSIGGMGGVVAQDGVTDSGNVLVDSWDSSSSLHSIWATGGTYRRNFYNPLGTQYGIWSNSLSYVSNSYPSRTANVYVFTDTNVIDLSGGIRIAGYLQTGPGGSETMSGNASVGDMGWVFTSTGSKNQSGLEPGHYQQDANENFHSYPLPVPTNAWQTTWTNVPTLANGSVIKIGGVWWYTNSVWTNIGGAFYTNTGSGFSIGGVTYSLVITNRVQNTNWVYYSMNQLGQNLFVDAQYVVLYLTNGWSYSGQDTFSLNTNADIQVWTTGDISTSGQGTINNFGNYTHAFSVYDVAGHPISVSLTGNGAATGYYYLPSSTLSFSGGGSSGDFVGAVVCYSINDSGGMNIHFDQSLGNSTTPDQFIPSSWTEVTTQ